MIATCLDRTDHQGNNIESVFFMSATIPGIILSCAWRNGIVRVEGHPDELWDIPGGGHTNAVPVAEVVEEQVEIDEDIF